MSIVTKRTFCRFCHAACAIEADINTATNEVVAIRGDSNDPIFGSYTCIKGRHLPEQHNNAERLRTSLKRRPNGGFDEIPTAQAFDEIAERFSRILAEHGPRALASYCGTATFQNAAAHPVARAFHAAIGSPSYYTSITIDQPAKMVTPLRMGAWHAGEQPWNTADVSLIVGINIVVSMLGIPGGPTFVNPLASLREAKKNGLKLIVIDPRRTETAAMADIHLQVTPGEDPTLLAGMLRVILDEDLIDHEFCDKWVNGLPELHRSLRTFDLDHVSHRTTVPVDDIVKAARMFAAGKRGSATCGTGPNMAPRGPMIEHLAAAFNVLCGRFPREGEQVQNGTGVIGIYGPGFEPKAQVRPASPESLTNGAKARVRGLSAINGQAPTAALPDEILEPGEGQVRGLLTVGGNPVLAWPDQIKAVRALETLDTHVALDIRVSATARLAHYVIPSRLSLERPDIPTNVDRWFEEPYVMYTPALIEGGAEMVDEANLYIEIAQRMGLTLKLPGGDIAPDTKASPDDLLELAFPWARVPWAEMRATEGAKLHPELTMTVAAADPDCTSKFELVPAGLDVELAEVRAERDSYGGLAGYDPEVHTHRMASRRLKGVFNSSGREIEALRKKEGTSYAHAHPDDLAKWGVKDGDLVDISSPRSTIRTVVKAATDIKPGTISMAHSWGDLPGEQGPPADPYTLGDTTGRLSDCTTGADPITGLPVMSAIPVTVKPA